MKRCKLYTYMIGGVWIATLLFSACAPADHSAANQPAQSPGTSGTSIFTSKKSAGAWAASPTDENYTPEEALKYVTITDHTLQDGRLILTLCNTGAKNFMFGKQYTIEMETEKGWRPLPFRDDVAWESIGILLTPGSQEKFTYDLGELANPLQPGQYRITLDGYQVGRSFSVG